MLNETHDPALKSWLASANEPGTDFPLQNLPFGVFRHSGSAEPFRGGVALGDQILDLSAALAAGLLDAGAIGPQAAAAAGAAASAPLNALMAAGAPAWSALRLALSRVLRQGAAQARELARCLVPQGQAEYAVPARIGDYSDFYASIHHATAVGKLLRPDNPLLPNYKWVPIGYHGRASSIGVSGQQFARPLGQVLPAGASAPVLRPSERLDYELELGVYIGPGNERGSRIELGAAEAHAFGLCVLNDWSARAVQAWEYQPLGPFLAKSFATTISPWIVTLEALEPFRVPWTRPADDPAPLAYLEGAENRRRGAFAIELEVLIVSQAMRAAGRSPQRLSRTSFRHCYWSVAQLITHHTVGGCNLEPGDLLGTGTQSGPTPEEAGSLLELSRGGRQPLELPGGERRTFLADGDTVIMRAWAEQPGAVRIGFGEAAGTVLPVRT
jgi:fumarylacetoacetase